MQPGCTIWCIPLRKDAAIHEVGVIRSSLGVCPRWLILLTADVPNSVSKLEQWTAEVVPGSFHWLIAEPKDAVAYSSTHEKVHQIKAITGQNLVKQWPFLQLHLEPVLFVMKRANSA
eukprot:TRINITY_DN10522_c0_g1_i1.p1 TRINITY_DN10522_c0_g1~~TRINITY_DN10522_c0_g1_i1.p1  ORF type:complete len:117 (+),score=16.01 TRINITY_DN10522_c0_g1_i1:549-899(+)